MKLKHFIKLRRPKFTEKPDDAIIKKAGLPPGTLVYVGKRTTPSIKLTVIDYNEHEIHESEVPSIDESVQYKKNGKNSWINFDGIDHAEEVGKLGAIFDLHILLIEDMLNTQHRPKLELFDECLFLTIKMLKLKGNEGEEQEIEVEQVSFVLGHGWLLSFQEVEGDVFETIRKRLRDQTSPLRKNNIDYLFYRLVDTIVDNYFAVIEYLGERMEDLEEEIMVAPNEDLRWKMQVLRKEIVQLRKSVVPLREAIGVLAKEENHFVKKATTRYFLDVFEHVIQLTDYIDTQRDMLSSLVDLYLSGVSFKMNQVMKVLTIISTIFIPLTFIAGIYGMNFEYMPELHWANGYFGTLAVMVVMVIGMLFYFKRKDWL